MTKDSTEPSLTPMMQQWYELKARCGSALLFFRLGDFYELFDTDAIKAAPILGVTLTSRNNKGSSQGPSVPLCGVPVANIETYLTRALNAGLKIALAEQMEEPKPGKTIVKRDIVQWFTPGVRLIAQDDQPHYAAVVSRSGGHYVVAAADVGTGHTLTESLNDLDQLKDLVDRLPIQELRYCELLPNEFLNSLPSTMIHEALTPLSHLDAQKEIEVSLGISHVNDANISSKEEKIAFGTLIKLLNDYHPLEKLHFLKPHHQPDTVWTSASTRRNLHLFDPKDQCLFKLIDRTATAVGRRYLKLLLSSPTQSLDIIQHRQKLVSFFKGNTSIRQLLRSRAQGIYDLSRLLRRRPSAETLFKISQSLQQGLSLVSLLPPSFDLFLQFSNKSQHLESLRDLLDSTLQWSENPSTGWIKTGCDATLDDLRKLKEKSEHLLSELEESLRQETGISSLKIKFHQVFGYVVEVTATHKDKVPSRAKRIQTLANAERFKIEELNQLEEKLLSLDSRIREAESSLLEKLIVEINAQRDLLLDWLEKLSQIDAFQSLAQASSEHGWSTPKTLSQPGHLFIERGFHPLAHGSFVPLDIHFDDSLKVMLLTGPNMSGKSTVLRLAAVIAWLHQIGSDIPAQSAELSIFDRIMCRMGAGDDLTSGQSTFFLEMREVATMLSGATERSLLLFDEIGRGTSTYDGMSLAWAITEKVHSIKSLSFMATHYLELAELEKTLSLLRSYHLGVSDSDHQLIFTRKLLHGPASRSYGIQVARLAHVDDDILNRAQEKLRQFEKKRSPSTPLGPLFH